MITSAFCTHRVSLPWGSALHCGPEACSRAGVFELDEPLYLRTLRDMKLNNRQVMSSRSKYNFEIIRNNLLGRNKENGTVAHPRRDFKTVQRREAPAPMRAGPEVTVLAEKPHTKATQRDLGSMTRPAQVRPWRQRVG